MFGLARFCYRPLWGISRSVNFVPNSLPVLQINPLIGLENLQCVRFMNRNARRPKKANHGKRPCSHARRWAKRGKLTSVAYREKIFGFW